MKKIITLVLCILMAVLMFAAPMTATASSWGPDVSTGASMYTLAITQYSTGRDGTGTLGYYAYTGANVAAGDYVSFSIELKIPTHKVMVARYGVDPGEDGAKLQLTPAGITPVASGGAVISTALTASIPAGADAERTLYYAPDGKWYTSPAPAMWTGYVTDASKAALTAAVAYDMDLSKITLQYGAHDYKICKDSSGYIAYDNESAMLFVSANNGLVTSVSLAVDGRVWHRLYATRSGYLVEGDSAAGVWAAIASGYFSAMGFTFDDVYAGGVYITPKNLLLHFGPPAECSASVFWSAAPVSSPAVYPVTVVPSVPATGAEELMLAAVIFTAGILIFAIWPRRGKHS